MVEQVKQAKIPETAIDDAVRQLLRDKFELGYFEPVRRSLRARQISGEVADQPFAWKQLLKEYRAPPKQRPQLLPLQAAKHAAWP